MTQVAVEQIIGRMLLDPEFRNLMASDLPIALVGYDLTEGEREGFTNVDLEDFNSSVVGLDQRVSKGVSMN